MSKSKCCHIKCSTKLVKKYPEFIKNCIKVSWKAVEMGVVAKS